MTERQQRERADREGAGREGQQQRQAVLLQRRAILFDAVDPVEAPFDLSEQRASGHERANEAEGQSGPTV